MEEEIVIAPHQSSEITLSAECSKEASDAFEKLCRQLHIPDEPLFVGTPRERSIYDIWTSTPVELPRVRLTMEPKDA